MPFRAKMCLEQDESNEITVLAADYEFVQPIDSQSYPKGLPKPNVLRVVVESSKDNRLIEWMVSPLMTKSVQILFYGDTGATLRTIEMKDAYCIGYRETFDADSSVPMKITLRLAEAKEEAKVGDDTEATTYDASKAAEVVSPAVPETTQPSTPETPALESDESPLPPPEQCTTEGEPVDVASGRMLNEEVDFDLPGPINFSWKRTWYNSSKYLGPLGSGWHHSYDLSLTTTPKKIMYRTNDGRDINFPLLQAGTSKYLRSDKLTLSYDGENYSIYNHQQQLQYSFQYNVYLQKHALKGIFNADGFAIRFEYNNIGLLVKIIDSSNRVLLVKNDSDGHIANILLEPAEPTDVSQLLVSYQYQYSCLISIANPLGGKRHFIYNEFLQIIEQIFRTGIHFYFKYDGTGHDAKCTHTWGDGNVLGYQFVYFPEEGKTISTNSLGFVTTYYHQNGLVIKKIDPYGNITLTKYNEYSELIATTDALGNTIRHAYDNMGNLTETRFPNGATQKTRYQNNIPISATNADGGNWKWEYDAAGHLVRLTNPLGQDTTYVYTDGFLTELLDAAKNVTLFNYNKKGQLRWMQTPNGQRTTWEYNHRGLSTAIIFPNGTKKSYIMMLLGMLLELKTQTVTYV